ncbi:conserved hypothetical protein [Leishmania major strain Friedlin]|uniref:EF-hand domain-containing protein n=1 Tax=Leishmania major TaxID=5664 RepID=Q4Q082_LEIMA|nr:conserved hypothetical protein [Leishmania major strain Friedlin]CAG9584238.1 hypothetical_protein_-_conserved [Leishmania major strain Friedlin]CAJ09653.1 conserved hypothetical protein [Leishmania major strain Friedlin]|eukprot:XP_001687266.1 conserved hypothetical protein [Leishmania major strain Friedlin]
MSVEDDYRASIAQAREEDRNSRGCRRKLRNEYQDDLLKTRIVHARNCFLRDVRFHSARRSTAEESLMLTLRSTAACWSKVCERSITRQLDIESAKKQKQLRDIAFLERTHQREVYVQRSVEETDQARWGDFNARHAAQLLADRNAAVQATLEDMMERTAQCLSELGENHLSHAGTTLLAAFSVEATLRRLSSVDGVAVSAVREAFHHIFHGSPYAQSSPAFLALLAFCYGQQQPKPPLAQVHCLCSVPILVVDGPKYSGKSLLANFLKSKYRLLCISDETLVQRALHAASSDAMAKEEEGADDWAELGRCLQVTLLDGGAVSVQLMMDLLCLQLTELRNAREALPYDAVLLEGVVRSVDAYKMLAQRLSNPLLHPYLKVAQRWGLSTTALVGGGDGGSSAADEATAGVLPPLLRLPDHPSSEYDTPAKPEPKARPLKKVDLAALPPAELPEVEDTEAAQEAERAFVARAERELASLPTVLSGVLHISCAPEEVFHRFAGLRTDCETGARYHLTYNPPPQERLPYMLPLCRLDTSSVELHEAVFHHMEGWGATRRWLAQQSEGPTFARVYELAGDGPAAEVQKEALEAVDQIISHFRISRQLLHERDASAARLSELEATWQSQKAAREAERLRLVELYTEKGAPIPPALHATVAKTSGSSATTLSAAAASIIFKALTNFTDLYEGSYAGTWSSMTHLVQLFLRYHTSVESQMALYWKRPDDKQAILHRFQRCFDSLPASMRVLPACKAELHLSLDALDEALHRCIALRDGEARGLLDTLTSAASFMGGWQTLVCQAFTRLLQAEADRYFFAMHIFSFFLGAVIGEPLGFDDVEVDVPLTSMNTPDRLTPSTSVAGDASPSVSPGGKSTKEKRVTSTKKSHKVADEPNEKIAEDQLAEVAQGVLNGFSSITDKLKAVVDVQGKAPKRAASGGGSIAGNSPAAPTSIFAIAAAKCYGFMEAERVAATSRVAAIHSCGRMLLKEAEAHAKKMRMRMEASLLDVMAGEAAAANTAVYVLRECVEAEKKSPAMHLGCTTFAVLGERPSPASQTAGGAAEALDCASPTPTKIGSTSEERRSFLTDVPLFAQLTKPQFMVHPGRTAARLLELAQQFRCVAPDYQLSNFDFLLLVEDDDYAEAAVIGLDAAHMTRKTREELFSTFDPQRTGFVDWRDVIVHLLFWVTPGTAARTPTSAAAQRGIREISLQDLLKTRAALGVCGLTEEQFFEKSLFLDHCLDEALVEAHMRILWCTFHDAANQILQPHILLGFLCADPQPIRGAQKAFHVLSAPGAEGRVSLDEMDALCHLKATNARLMDQPDPCSKMNLRLLFGTAATCSFEEVCASPMGRKMLNHADLFRRRQFFKRK